MSETYDLCVIGGGSGGLAAAKEAAGLGASVVLLDYVDPSPQGTKWGLGGTCVNVGCIPKKLFHNSAQFGEVALHDAKALGWSVESATMNWEVLTSTVNNYIKSLNFTYRNSLRKNNVKYINARATITSPTKVEYEAKGEKQVIDTKYILIATGCRPIVPNDIPGASEFALTSDDLFWMTKPPGKTLCVGASYISLECAGFLTGMGFDVTVAVRSILLRGFDRQCAEKIGSLMEQLGTKFYTNTTISKISKDSSTGQLVVEFNGGRETERFDTVLYATGRRPNHGNLGLENVGVRTMGPNSSIVTDTYEMTNVPTIFAIGDVCFGRPELTPVAIKAGQLLAQRLFSPSKSGTAMNYSLIPTVVFTPVEYGCCGLSEEDAIAKYGEENIETFLFEFSPVSASAVHKEKHPRARKDETDVDISPLCLSKLVCLKNQDMKVIGYHCVAPQAGETIQGFALALLMGATKAHFDTIVGVHPTDAESFVGLTVTRASGQSFTAVGGCGGGSCG